MTRISFALLVPIVLSGCDGRVSGPAESDHERAAQAWGSLFDDGHTVVVAAHNDDELLWFQPFLPAARQIIQAMGGPAPAHVTLQAAAYGGPLVHTFPAYTSDEEYMRDFLRRDPCGQVAEVPPAAGSVYLTQGRDLKLSFEEVRERLRPWIADPQVWRVVTHNHWGEYGHAHHRMLSAVVRELAREYGKDVWIPSFTRVSRATPDPASAPGSTTYYRNEGDLLGLQLAYRRFVHTSFAAARQLYIDAMLPWPGRPNDVYSTWTWHMTAYDYPSGWRPFVKIVDAGLDHTGPSSPSDTAGQQRLERILGIRDNDATLYGSCGHTAF